MNDKAAAHPSDESCFQMKSVTLSMTVLELHFFQQDEFETLLREKIRQAPGLFKDIPLIVSLERYQRPANELDFFQIIGVCRRHNMQVVAVRGGDEDMRRLARHASLAWLPASTQRERSPETVTPAPAVAVEPPAPAEATPAPAAGNHSVTGRVVGQPIRSGQQVYESRGDLVITAQVGAGAEVMAAGNVHIYGAARGRILAGVHGDTQARIFCNSLEAELISIAGQYKISEDLQGTYWKRPVQIHLKDDALIITPLD